MNILITGCCGVVSRAIARSVRLSEHYCAARLIGADVCENWYGLHESLFDTCYRLSSVENVQDYSKQIAKILIEEKIDLAIITPEKEVLTWVQNNFGVPVTLPPPEFSKIASNKRKLYEHLATTGLVPDFGIYKRNELLDQAAKDIINAPFPCWIRDCSTGTDSGRGALKVSNIEEVRAWVVLNPGIDNFMISAFLKGRNYAQCLLFNDGHLLKSCSYERLDYFMAEVAPSGVTGNICRGRLVDEELVRINAEKAVREIANITGEPISGLLTVDLREDENAIPFITEINVRHTAATSAYAAGGCNMVEAQIHHTLGRFDLIDNSPANFPKNNYILRDIDGAPCLIEDINLPEPGEVFQACKQTPC